MEWKTLSKHPNGRANLAPHPRAISEPRIKFQRRVHFATNGVSEGQLDKILWIGVSELQQLTPLMLDMLCAMWYHGEVQESKSSPRSSWSKFPQGRELKAFSPFERVNKYLVNSIFSYDCPNAILVDFKYSRVATGHRGSKWEYTPQPKATLTRTKQSSTNTIKQKPEQCYIN